MADTNSVGVFGWADTANTIAVGTYGWSGTFVFAPTLLSEPPTLGIHGIILGTTILFNASHIPNVLANASNIPTDNLPAESAPDRSKSAEYAD